MIYHPHHLTNKQATEILRTKAETSEELKKAKVSKTFAYSFVRKNKNELQVKRAQKTTKVFIFFIFFCNYYLHQPSLNNRMLE